MAIRRGCHVSAKGRLAMIGTMIVLEPGASPAVKQITTNGAIFLLAELQKLVGGYIEPVPYFSSIQHGGRRRHCVAFCNEDGKRLDLPRNVVADLLWREAQRDHNVDLDDA